MNKSSVILSAAMSLAIAGCGADSASVAPPSPAASDAPAPSSAQMSADASAPERNAELRDTGGPPVPLPVGMVSTPNGFDPPMTLEVGEGWYGHGNRDGFAVGKGLNEAEERFGSVEMDVGSIDMPIAEAVARFRATDGLLEGEPTTGTLDGHSTTVFAARTAGSAPVILEDALGIGADCCGPSGQQIFVDLGSKTILIRTGIYEASATAELEDVLASIRFRS